MSDRASSNDLHVMDKEKTLKSAYVIEGCEDQPAPDPVALAVELSSVGILIERLTAHKQAAQHTLRNLKAESKAIQEEACQELCALKQREKDAQERLLEKTIECDELNHRLERANVEICTLTKDLAILRNEMTQKPSQNAHNINKRWLTSAASSPGSGFIATSSKLSMQTACSNTVDMSSPCTSPIINVLKERLQINDESLKTLEGLLSELESRFYEMQGTDERSRILQKKKEVRIRELTDRYDASKKHLIDVETRLSVSLEAQEKAEGDIARLSKALDSEKDKVIERAIVESQLHERIEALSNDQARHLEQIEAGNSRQKALEETLIILNDRVSELQTEASKNLEETSTLKRELANAQKMRSGTCDKSTQTIFENKSISSQTDDDMQASCFPASTESLKKPQKIGADPKVPVAKTDSSEITEFGEEVEIESEKAHAVKEVTDEMNSNVICPVCLNTPSGETTLCMGEQCKSIMCRACAITFAMKNIKRLEKDNHFAQGSGVIARLSRLNNVQGYATNCPLCKGVEAIEESSK